MCSLVQSFRQADFEATTRARLGLLAVSEENLTGLLRKWKTNKWLERLLCAHVNVSDIKSQKEDIHKQRLSAIDDDVKNVDLLERWKKPARPRSFRPADAAQVSVEKLDTSFNKRKSEPFTNERVESAR
ncbi:hypothetical protein FB567DRAFT_44436 [Paraphoma chrysanthemicola]|uniref:Uncharacterized protein n=1 Tax=Paraphoma chrysanthemicola TaxID=798071 RepID=A0A8K0RGX0_9PLEO|nr:hypothetical protein FB567DRAFT_44436 [Paraphoma chrysanthemicola]